MKAAVQAGLQSGDERRIAQRPTRAAVAAQTGERLVVLLLLVRP